MRSLVGSFRRDWMSWSRVERVAAVGVFVLAPLGAALGTLRAVAGF